MTRKQKNPRDEAMASVVANRMQDKTEDGRTFEEVMDEQGMDFADPEAELEPELKDSDSGQAGLGKKEVEIDIEDDTITPEGSEISDESIDEQDHGTVEAEAEDETLDVDQDEETDGEETHEVGPLYERDGKYYAKVKIDGEEKEISYDQLKASAQKDQASFERFQQAAAMQQANEERARQLDEREAELKAQSAQRAAAPAPVVEQPGATKEDIDPKAVAEELYDALAFEDEETVRKKIAKFVSGQAKTRNATGRGEESSTQREGTADVQAAVRAELERMRQNEWQTARKAAVAQWEIDYEDVANDEQLRNIANIRATQIAKAHPEQPLEVTLQQAGEFARQFGDTQTAGGQQPTVDEDSGETRKQRKQKIPAPVRTNSKAASRKGTEEKPLTRSQVVAQIRAGRGQEAA